MAYRSRQRRGRQSKSSPSRASASERTPLFRVYIAISLDGYIADSKGSVDWLNPYFSSEIDFAGFMRTIGATVMGRRTFDQAVARGDGSAGGSGTIVLTHRPLDNPPAGVEAFHGDVRDLASRLREKLATTGKDIWLIGGGRSIAAFHEAGVVDRWEISIIPVLLGDGIPLFPRHSRGLDGLRLTHGRALSNGIMELHYEPQGQGPRRAAARKAR